MRISDWSSDVCSSDLGDPGKPRFIIDPLDGTSNFLHAIPHFAISIAVQEPKPGGRWGDDTAAPLHQPVTHANFWAARGRGAFLPDPQHRVRTHLHLHERMIAPGTPHSAQHCEHVLVGKR